jgi:epoxyqueuosine reductase QueG
MNMSSVYVKKMAVELGADLCGIASVDRFEKAPEGFHPCDVLPECQSVIVLACRFLKSTLFAKSTIPYTDVRNELSRKMDQLAINLSYQLETNNVLAIPINSIGPTEWDAKTQKSRGIISLKHAAVLAGLGKIGKNTLLINEQYGNMIWLSAVLLSVQLQPDPLAQYEGCIPNCHICLESCPVQALDGVSMNQKACWEYAFGTHNGGEWRIKCFTCRKVCPHC